MRQINVLLTSKELPVHHLINDFVLGSGGNARSFEHFCMLKNKLTIKYASKYIQRKLASTISIKYVL